MQQGCVEDLPAKGREGGARWRAECLRASFVRSDIGSRRYGRRKGRMLIMGLKLKAVLFVDASNTLAELAQQLQSEVQKFRL